MRKLASIRYITELKPIEGADFIELAIVDGWNCVVQKGQFQYREMVVYFEIDSFLPIHPIYEFLRKSSYKKMSDQEGFRLRTIRLKGIYSQGLILPIKDFIKEGLLEDKIYYISENVTEQLKIQKYEPPIPAELSGIARGNFPSEVPKTDEERCQNLDYPKLKGLTYYITEKLDGSSVTIYLKDNEFGVCSRNINLLESNTNTFWTTVRKLDIEKLLRDNGLNNIVLQGELIGEGIQGNIYNLKGHDIRFFNVYDIEKRSYYSYIDFKNFIDKLGLRTVPILDDNKILKEDREELISSADGKSLLNNKVDREGIVMRTLENYRVSFKVISNKYLLKEK